ncbi:MAG TPA: 3-oxoacyl-[acyl-carrier-protein] reductase [Myxococcaceae bacterium]|nr:3-oxoacyl-[acyl-carrier-protein] reductase [Myxococcaceae bacterium]
MYGDLKEKVVLLTGGSRGIGRACAIAFAGAGARVVFSYAGNEPAANETVDLAEKAGGKAKATRFDVSDTRACGEAVDEVVKEFGRLDVLVNNAGVAVDGLVMRVKDEDWDKQFDINLKGAFALIRAATRPMMKQRGGAIVNLTSVVGEMGNAGQAAYAASKAGLIGLTKSIARELASRNIRCNAVSPGFIGTDMTAHLPEETRKNMMATIPLARLGTPEDVAQAVLFLASDAAAYVTGEVLRVNGGMYM